MNRPTRLLLTLIAAFALLLSACGSSGSKTAAPNTAEAGSGSTTSSGAGGTDTSDSAKTPAFPVTVEGGNGEVAIAARPERIVVLSASLTESVFAVGAGKQVVAVDKYSNYPKGVPTTDLSGFKPNVESIAALKPDLVLLSRDSSDIVSALGKVGVAALVLPSAKSLDEVYEQIETVGVATGHRDEATKLASQMRSDVDAQLARLKGVTLPKSFFYEMSDDYKTLTSKTFIGSILAKAGLSNIADGAPDTATPYPQLSAEFILNAKPELVLVAHTDGSTPTIDDLRARPGWDAIPAVSDGKVIFLDTEIASRWGPRVVDLVTEIVDGLVGKS